MTCVTDGCDRPAVELIRSNGATVLADRCGPHELSALRAQIERLTFYESQLSALLGA